MARRAKLTSITAVLWVLLCSLANQTHAAYLLKAPDSPATEGYLSLEWAPAANHHSAEPSLLQVSHQVASGTTTTYPVHSQTRITLSGLTDGQYVAQLTDTNGDALSNSAQFRVEHRSLTVATALFALGALLFVALILTIFQLSRRGTE